MECCNSGNLNNAGVFVLINDGKGNFTTGPVISAPLQPGEGSLSSGMAIADFNKDGHNDIGFSPGYEFYVSTGSSYSTISTPFTATIVPAFAVPINMSYSAVADIDKDGCPDIVFTSSYRVLRLYNVPVPTGTPCGRKSDRRAEIEMATKHLTIIRWRTKTPPWLAGTLRNPALRYRPDPLNGDHRISHPAKYESLNEPIPVRLNSLREQATYYCKVD